MVNWEVVSVEWRHMGLAAKPNSSPLFTTYESKKHRAGGSRAHPFPLSPIKEPNPRQVGPTVVL